MYALFTFILFLGTRKNALHRFTLIKKICFVSFHVSILLSIKTCTFLNVFVSFRYRICSISKALLSKTFIIYVQFLLTYSKNTKHKAEKHKFRAGWMQDRRIQERMDSGMMDSRKDGFKKGWIQERRDARKEGCKKGGMQKRKDLGEGGMWERRDDSE